MPADAQHPLPSDGFPDGPGHPAFTDAQFPRDPVLDELLDWETEALPRKEDPYWSHGEQGEPRDEEEWLEESYILAAPGAPGPERFAVGGAADAMAPGPVLAILADRAQRDGLEQLMMIS